MSSLFEFVHYQYIQRRRHNINVKGKSQSQRHKSKQLMRKFQFYKFVSYSFHILNSNYLQLNISQAFSLNSSIISFFVLISF